MSHRRAFNELASYGPIPYERYLVGVYLMSVHLTGVHHLIGVYFMGMHLTGVYVMGVHLMSVYFMGIAGCSRFYACL
jgi:hypothetical protein